MLNEVIAAIVPVLLPVIASILVRTLNRYLALQESSEAAQAINLAVERAAGVVYRRALQLNVPLSDDRGLTALVEEAARDAAVRVPQAMQALGVHQVQLIDMVHGSFGRVIAADPTIAGPAAG